MNHAMAVGSAERVIGRVLALDTSIGVMVDSVRGMRRGAIRFILHGKKLKGGFSLVRMRESDQWLLTKRDDMYARDDAEDISPKEA